MANGIYVEVSRVSFRSRYQSALSASVSRRCSSVRCAISFFFSSSRNHRRRRPSIRSSKARRELQTREVYTQEELQRALGGSEATVSHAVWHLTPTNAPPRRVVHPEVLRREGGNHHNNESLTLTDRIFLL